MSAGSHGSSDVEKEYNAISITTAAALAQADAEINYDNARVTSIEEVL